MWLISLVHCTTFLHGRKESYYMLHALCDTSHCTTLLHGWKESYCMLHALCDTSHCTTLLHGRKESYYMLHALCGTSHFTIIHSVPLAACQHVQTGLLRVPIRRVADADAVLGRGVGGDAGASEEESLGVPSRRRVALTVVRLQVAVRQLIEALQPSAPSIPAPSSSTFADATTSTVINIPRTSTPISISQRYQE